MEAANKNFILLKRKFGGDLSEALLAQSDSPLGYGSEFKPIETLEPIFENHPSWKRMKRILTHGSKWPLQPLEEENRIKDVEDALNFGNHNAIIENVYNYFLACSSKEDQSLEEFFHSHNLGNVNISQNAVIRKNLSSFNDKTRLISNTLIGKYYSDMSGGVNETDFYNRSYSIFK